jgi:glutathione S-transferase
MTSRHPPVGALAGVSAVVPSGRPTWTRSSGGPRPAGALPAAGTRGPANRSPGTTMEVMPAMKLYWGPHTCAIGTHLLLEEIGRPYAAEKIDVAGGATKEPWFTGINPKSKVPTLVLDDGRVLTEFGAIAVWLARQAPDRKLLPTDPDEEQRALSLLDYAVGTIHGQGFGRVFMPERFEPQDPVHQTLGLGQGSVKRLGRHMIGDAFAIVDQQLVGREWAAGDAFGVADAALFYVERWAPEAEVDLPPNVAAHFARVKARPAAAKVMQVWGEG